MKTTIFTAASAILAFSSSTFAAPTGIVAPGATLQQAGSGYAFTEGPAADKAGNVYFTDQPNDRILKWTVDGKITTFLSPSGRSNGLCVDHHGDILACADEHNRLWRIDKDGKSTVVVKDYQGKLLDGPNDVWERPDGGVYFTDPYYKRPWWRRGPEEQSTQGVYYLTPKGEAFTAIENVTLTVEPGQFCAIVGPTGCGKSTTLAQVSGLESPSSGSVAVGGHRVNGITPGVSYMFQADSLFPWKSVLNNVMTGPVLLGTPKRDATVLARDWLRRVGLAGFEDRFPHQLSGGMRKRVAMAAALINRPRILLMDEPFGALDVQTKAIMQNELLDLWEESRPSVLFITHDLDEAVALSDRVVIMTSSPGSVKDVFDIDLPRPRGDVQAIRHDERFLELQGQIWESLRAEVNLAYAQTAGAA